MNKKLQLALVGGGQMGRALVGGMLAGGVVAEGDVHLVEPNPTSAGWWVSHHGEVAIGELPGMVAAADVVFLAVKPNVIAKVADQGKGFWDGKLVISIAAGVDLQSLVGWIGHGRVVRVMPNTPSLVGAGASGFCCGDGVTEADKLTIAAMLESVGVAIEVTEPQMDGVTGVSGSGPAYVCMIVEAMADGGVAAGLPRDVAMRLATQTVLGTAKMIAETGRHPGELKDAVASPGGTTIAAIASLEQNGLRSAMIQAVQTAAAKSRAMGK